MCIFGLKGMQGSLPEWVPPPHTGLRPIGLHTLLCTRMPPVLEVAKGKKFEIVHTDVILLTLVI